MTSFDWSSRIFEVRPVRGTSTEGVQPQSGRRLTLQKEKKYWAQGQVDGLSPPQRIAAPKRLLWLKDNLGSTLARIGFGPSRNRARQGMKVESEHE
ncbi:hypothetical protein [Pseudomonas aeruginosa]|uniref:hypothetical protein n=1 Tax=Pseudomonas aeruginosa TaxID=287 RepID=UPI001068CFB2|nr:hypothetical protein [Pseudomonas aeruginosa]TEC25392.1 hypothetical protein IPC1597_19015 [Pseudomonas aeruginosa]